VNVDVITQGCAGSKITVTPRILGDERISSDEEQNGIRCWVVPELAGKLDGAQIARAKGKYYLVSKNIASRCGCGTSFSFEKKTIPTNLAKIHRLQNALKISPEIQKIQKHLQDTRKK
jgi:Fe-S cluster assembly iron-binding protein IscA